MIGHQSPNYHPLDFDSALGCYVKTLWPPWHGKRSSQLAVFVSYPGIWYYPGCGNPISLVFIFIVEIDQVLQLQVFGSGHQKHLAEEKANCVYIESGF